MNDKELFMMAAKAVNLLKDYCVGEFTEQGVFLMPFAEMPDLSDPKSAYFCSEPVSKIIWNPLTDDGDALRLAVKLRMDINISHRTNEVIAYTMTDKIGRADEKWSVDIDEYAATRRAIVRAAAEIGRWL